MEEERETKQKRWRRGVGKEVERKNTSCSHGESLKNKQENQQVAMEVPRNIFLNLLYSHRIKKGITNEQKYKQKRQRNATPPLCRIIVSLSENNNFRISLHNNAFLYYMV